MTQFKVGDRVRRANGKKIWDTGPDTAIIKSLHDGNVFSVVGHPYNGKSSYDDTKAWVFDVEDFTLATPPATIQHEGYNYTRGEPVVPEWVKDGAWVVNIFSDELRQVKEVKPGVFDLVVNDLVSIRYQDAIRGQYRPFTNEDWKWGMWAEYKGEKVFVMNGIDKSGYVEISGKPISLNTLDGWNLAPASELTPTTAP